MDNKKNTLNRRDTLKSLLIGGIAISTLARCETKVDRASTEDQIVGNGGYGRTEEEKLHDEKIKNQKGFFTDHEAATLADLIDYIVPIDDQSGSANDAEVMDFLGFIVKDMTQHQMPLRQGLAWMDRKSNDTYNLVFKDLSSMQKTNILDLIAYPEDVLPENIPGEKFFSRLRNLTLTGFYTSKIGLEDLGYAGNRPNFWDGVPNEILQEHGFDYDKKYMAIYITEENRTKAAEWDDTGNLLS
jgi:hypothetical protein